MAFGREYVAATLLRGTGPETVLAMRVFDPRLVAGSVRSMDDLMKTCADLLVNTEMVRVSSQLQHDIGETCGTAARAILARNPGFARAYAAGLIAARADVTPAAYAQAAAAAPFEPWPLAMRLLSAERAMANGTLPADLTAPVSADMTHAVQSISGRDLLAGLYQRQTGLRDLIQTAVRARPDAEQRGFVNALRALAAADG